MSNHTPTPWKDPNVIDNEGFHAIVTTIGKIICTVFQKENAAHIIKCVNMHDELVEALQYALKQVEDCCPNLTNTPKVIRAVLAKAKGDK